MSRVSTQINMELNDEFIEISNNRDLFVFDSIQVINFAESFECILTLLMATFLFDRLIINLFIDWM